MAGLEALFNEFLIGKIAKDLKVRQTIFVQVQVNIIDQWFSVNPQIMQRYENVKQKSIRNMLKKKSADILT